MNAATGATKNPIRRTTQLLDFAEDFDRRARTSETAPPVSGRDERKTHTNKWDRLRGSDGSLSSLPDKPD